MPNLRFTRPSLRMACGLALAATLGGGFLVYQRNAAVAVTVAPVVRGNAVQAIYATGIVEAQKELTIRSRVAGTVKALIVDRGSFVHEGDPLIEIDSPETIYDLERGQAELAAALKHAGASSPQIAALRARASEVAETLADARSELRRLETLAREGSTAPVTLDRAAVRVHELEAQQRAVLAEQQALRIDLGTNARRQSAIVRSLASRANDTIVRSPLTGMVLSRERELGETVSLNDELFRIGDTERYIIAANVDEADIANIETGAKAIVSLYAFPDSTFEARVEQVYPRADLERKTFLVRLGFVQTPPKLRSGLSAEANIVAFERPNATLVATSAAATDRLWIVENGRARARHVQTGIKDLRWTEVVSGVTEGELVAVQGLEHLVDGMRVRTTVQAEKTSRRVDAATPESATLMRAGVK